MAGRIERGLGPIGIAVDPAGNVFVGFSNSPVVQEWNAITRALTTLDPSLGGATGVALDASGNLYLGNVGSHSVTTIRRACLDTSVRSEPFGGATDFVSVLPASQNLQGIFAPTSDQPWLTITDTTQDGVTFQTAENPGSARTAHLTVLGQSVTVQQAASPFTLPATTSTIQSAAGGTGSFLPLATPGENWTSTSNASWIHISGQSSSGSSNAVITYTLDPNNPADPAKDGTTLRTGTITVGGQTYTVMQAGSIDLPANALVKLFSTAPNGVAGDSHGTLYAADAQDGQIVAWDPVTQNPFALATGINPQAIAVDAKGNLYFSDFGAGTVSEWVAATQTIQLLASGLSGPFGVAVDGAGNVYIAEASAGAIVKWDVTTQQVTTVVSGLGSPTSMALDGLGNLYFLDTSILEWNVSTQALSTPVDGTSLTITPETSLPPEARAFLLHLRKLGKCRWTRIRAASTNL